MLMYCAFTPDSVFKSVPPNGSEPTWQTSVLYSDIVPLIYVNETICIVFCPFYKIQVNRFMAQDDSSGAKIIPKYILWMRGLVPFWVLRHSFLSLTDCWWLYNIQLKSSKGVLFLPASDAYVRRFLYLLYTLIKLYYTKALSDQALSLAPDWILLLQRPRIPGSFRGSATTFHYNFSAVVWKPVAFLQGLSWCLCRGISKMKRLTWLSVVLAYPSFLRKQGHWIIQFTGVWIGIR